MSLGEVAGPDRLLEPGEDPHAHEEQGEDYAEGTQGDEQGEVVVDPHIWFDLGVMADVAVRAGGESNRLVLELDRVSFAYGGAPVLREASLRVRQGEFVAVVGSNGSGKTTLMKLGLGLLTPSAGRARLFGDDIRSFRAWHKVGYVPQRATSASALPVSVDEVVRSGLAARAHWLGRQRPEERQRIEHVVDLLDLSAYRRSPMAELSGGQQQRALIARALVTAPRLLVMDEPTTGVDAEARQILRASLEHLVDVEGMAVVYVSHDPEGFSGLAQRVVEVVDGRAGAHDEKEPFRHRVAARS